MLVFTLYECRGLRLVDPLGHQDPYVAITVGDNYVKKSKAIKGGGKDPYFEEEEIVMWVDDNLWMQDVLISVCDETMGPMNPIGSTEMSMLVSAFFFMKLLTVITRLHLYCFSLIWTFRRVKLSKNCLSYTTKTSERTTQTCSTGSL